MSAKTSNLKLKIRQLTEELQKKAEEELNERPSEIEEHLQHLRDWLVQQPHLNARQDDYFLLCFLRCCKFSLQKTKQKIDYFHSVRTLWPEFYGNRNPMSDDLQRLLAVGALLPLPHTIGASGPRIVILRWGVCNPSTIPYLVIGKLCWMMADILMQEDDNILVSGVYVLIDYQNFAPGYAVQLTPKVLYRSVNLLQSAYPLRIKGVAFMNVSTIVDVLVKLLISFFNKKMIERAHSYTEKSISDMYKYVPQHLLPKEYGGNAGSVTELTDHWKKKVESYSQWFEDDAKYCSDEALRPEESKGDLFGIDGTFRKLNID